MKKIVSLLMALLVLASCCVGFADTKATLLKVTPTENELRWDVKLTDDDAGVTGASLKVTKGATETGEPMAAEFDLEPSQIMDYQDIPTCWVFVVDDMKFSEDASEYYQSAISQILSLRSDGSEVAFITSSNVSDPEFTRESDKITTARNSIQNTNDTNFSGLVQTAADWLGKQTIGDKRVCVVLINVGVKEENAYTLTATAYGAISGLNPAIYQINILKESKENGKENSFANNEYGGLDCVFVNSNDVKRFQSFSEEISGKIKNNEKKFYQFKVNMEKIGFGGESYCELTIKTDQGYNCPFAETVELLYAGSAPDPIITDTPAPIITDTPAPVPPPTPTPIFEIIMNFVREHLVVVIAGACVIVLAVILIIVLSHKGGNDQKDQNVKVEPLDTTNEMKDKPADDGEKEEPTRYVGEDVTKVVPDSEWQIAIYPEGSTDRFVYDLSGHLILGRKPGDNGLEFANDDSISRTHADIWVEGESMKIKNLSTTNPTKVNGRAITGPTLLHQNDVVQMGRTKFVIQWRRKNG